MEGRTNNRGRHDPRIDEPPLIFFLKRVNRVSSRLVLCLLLCWVAVLAAAAQVNEAVASSMMV
jgi:hypothetical protein